MRHAMSCLKLPGPHCVLSVRRISIAWWMHASESCRRRFNLSFRSRLAFSGQVLNTLGRLNAQSSA